MSFDQAHAGRRRARRREVMCAIAMTLLLAATLLAPASTAQVANEQGVFGKVIRIDRGAFKPSAGLISFSEFPPGAKNPTYAPHTYGGDAKGVTVRFGGFFSGQRIGNASSCRGGGALTGCVVGKPNTPLELDPSSPPTLTAEDSATSSSPVLSGSPTFNGPVSMIFEPSVAGVGLVGGHFNALRGTAIQAFDRQGRHIGGVVNTAIGLEYMALVTEDGSESIAGLQFSLVGPEPYGFAVDSISFARRKELQESVRPAGREKSLGDLFRSGPRPEGGAPSAAAPPAPAPSGKSLKDLFK